MPSPTTLFSSFQIAIPKGICMELHWVAGQELVLIPKHKGVLVLPMPQLQTLAGIVRATRKDGYRERKDRY